MKFLLGVALLPLYMVGWAVGFTIQPIRQGFLDGLTYLSIKELRGMIDETEREEL